MSFHSIQRNVSNLTRSLPYLSLSAGYLNCAHLPVFLISSNRVTERNYHKFRKQVEKRIVWVKPTKIPSIDPRKSGDLSGLPEVDWSLPPPEFQESEEFKTANDLVKRVLSLQFQSRERRKEALTAALVSRVKRYNEDERSVEAKIARWTAIIRNMQVHFQNFPYDGKARADLKELIEFRKKRMKYLRRNDYKRFEWLLEQLDLLYRPPPPEHKWVTRKESMTKVAEAYCEDLKQKKLAQYKETLDSMKPEFIRRKLSTMEWIVAEEKQYNIAPSFSEEEIGHLQKMVNDLNRSERVEGV